MLLLVRIAHAQGNIPWIHRTTNLWTRTAQELTVWLRLVCIRRGMRRSAGLSNRSRWEPHRSKKIMRSMNHIDQNHPGHAEHAEDVHYWCWWGLHEDSAETHFNIYWAGVTTMLWSAASTLHNKASTRAWNHFHRSVGDNETRQNNWAKTSSRTGASENQKTCYQNELSWQLNITMTRNL